MFIESASVHRSRARIDFLRWPVLLALVLTFACTPAQRERWQGVIDAYGGTPQAQTAKDRMAGIDRKVASQAAGTA